MDHGTVLVEAAELGDMDLALDMLAAGADPSTSGEGGQTALHHAAGMGALVLVRALLDKGARTDIVDDFGHTPLNDACVSGSEECVEMLLAAKAPLAALGAEPPLHTASRYGFKEGLVSLLRAGSPVDAPDRRGRTALNLLAGSQAADDATINECAELLLAHGADPDTPSREDGLTPLMRAAVNGNPLLVSSLVRSGADFSVRTITGETCFDLCRGSSCEESLARAVTEFERKALGDCAGKGEDPSRRPRI